MPPLNLSAVVDAISVDELSTEFALTSRRTSFDGQPTFYMSIVVPTGSPLIESVGLNAVIEGQFNIIDAGQLPEILQEVINNEEVGVNPDTALALAEADLQVKAAFLPAKDRELMGLDPVAEGEGPSVGVAHASSNDARPIP